MGIKVYRRQHHRRMLGFQRIQKFLSENFTIKNIIKKYLGEGFS